MADPSQIIEVKVGKGEPGQLALTPGTVLDPTSVGRAGMWRVDGPGILDVHGYIYFDGKSLFVQSADEKQPVMVNKHRVATAWTEVRIPSTIELGRTELVYRAQGKVDYDDSDTTQATPLGTGGTGARRAMGNSEPTRAGGPMPQLPGAPPVPNFRPGTGSFARADDESTRFAPIEGAAALQQMPQAMGSSPANRDMTRVEPLVNDRGPATVPRPAAGQPAPYGSGMMMGGAPMGMGGQNPMGMQGGGMQGGMGMQGMGMQGGMQGMGMQGMGMQGGMQGMGGMSPMGMPMGTGPQQAQSGAGASAAGVDKLKADWAALPPLRKGLLLLSPFALVAAIMVLFGGDEEAAPAGTGARASGSAASDTTATMATAAVTPPMPQGMGPQTMPGVMPGVMPGAAPGMATGQMPDPGQAAAMAPANPKGPAGGGNAAGGNAAGGAPGGKQAAGGAPAGSADPSPPDLPPGRKTTERQAADAWSEGNFEGAARLYDQLANEQPQNPAYREAARILREKIDAGAR